MLNGDQDNGYQMSPGVEAGLRKPMNAATKPQLIQRGKTNTEGNLLTYMSGGSVPPSCVPPLHSYSMGLDSGDRIGDECQLWENLFNFYVFHWGQVKKKYFSNFIFDCIIEGLC